MKRLVVVLFAVLVLLSAGLVSCTPTLRIITEENPPYNFTDEMGNITGQSTEIVNRLIADTDSRATIDMMPWTQGYNMVQMQPGTALFSTNRIPEREKLFKWVGPIGSADNWLYSKAGAGIKISSMDDAKKVKSIAVYKDDSNQLYLQSQGFSNLDISQNSQECIKKVVGGKVDLWLGPAEGLHFVAYAAGINPAELEPVRFVHRADWYIAFNKETPDSTIKAWQTALDKLKKANSGEVSTYDDIVTSYALPRYVTDTVSKDAVIGLVERTAADFQQDASATAKAINFGVSPYVNENNRSLYVFVFDKYCTEVANADNPDVVGRNFAGVPDMAGKLFRDEIVGRALKEGSGWEDYVFTLPGKIGLYYKSAYFKLVTGNDGQQYIVCAGRYKTPGE